MKTSRGRKVLKQGGGVKRERETEKDREGQRETKDIKTLKWK